MSWSLVSKPPSKLQISNLPKPPLVASPPQFPKELYLSIVARKPQQKFKLWILEGYKHHIKTLVKLHATQPPHNSTGAAFHAWFRLPPAWCNQDGPTPSLPYSSRDNLRRKFWISLKSCYPKIAEPFNLFVEMIICIFS